MNERQAEEKGYVFHGAYSHDKEEMKARAAELRAAGNKAVIVNCPPSKYSRSHNGMGYSVYWIESAENIARRKREIAINKYRQLETELAQLRVRIHDIEFSMLELNKEIGDKPLTVECNEDAASCECSFHENLKAAEATHECQTK